MHPRAIATRRSAIILHTRLRKRRDYREYDEGYLDPDPTSRIPDRKAEAEWRTNFQNNIGMHIFTKLEVNKTLKI